MVHCGVLTAISDGAHLDLESATILVNKIFDLKLKLNTIRRERFKQLHTNQASNVIKHGHLVRDYLSPQEGVTQVVRKPEKEGIVDQLQAGIRQCKLGQTQSK